jgi:hypothetical protein
LDLRGLLFQLSSERLDLLLLLRHGTPQLLDFAIERGLLGGIGNDLGLALLG